MSTTKTRCAACALRARFLLFMLRAFEHMKRRVRLKTIEKKSVSSPGRDEFGLRAEWSGGVRAVRKSLLLAYQAWSRTRAQRSASQTRPSHRKRWSADLYAYAHSAGPGFVLLLDTRNLEKEGLKQAMQMYR